MAKAAAKIKAPAKPEDVVEIIDVEQGSTEWLEIRRGIVTASNLKIIMRSGKDGGESATRRGLLYKLAGEILSGEVEEGFKSEAMKRGNLMEPEAREYYARTTFAEVKQIGFIRRTLANGIVVGCSPDSQVGPKRGLEIKTMAPHLLIEQAEKGTPPTDHRHQIHGTMWVAGWDEMDLLLFYRGMPVAPRYRFERDDLFIKEISDEVERFDYDLKMLVKKIRSMGGAR